MGLSGPGPRPWPTGQARQVRYPGPRPGPPAFRRGRLEMLELVHDPVGHRPGLQLRVEIARFQTGLTGTHHIVPPPAARKLGGQKGSPKSWTMIGRRDSVVSGACVQSVSALFAQGNACMAVRSIAAPPRPAQPAVTWAHSLQQKVARKGRGEVCIMWTGFSGSLPAQPRLSPASLPCASGPRDAWAWPGRLGLSG